MSSKLINATVFIMLLIHLSCNGQINSVESDSSIKRLIVGTWKLQSTSGYATVGNKKIDLANELELTDKNGAKHVIKKTAIWVFDFYSGKQDEDFFTYQIKGKTIIINKINGDDTFILNFSINNNQLEITENETGIKPIIDNYNALLSNDKITSYHRIQKYKSLKNILSTNGTPGCLIESTTKITGDIKEINEYDYNDENKIIASTYTSIDTTYNSASTTNYRYVEERSNLGSNTKPYIICYIENSFFKYYCDKNGRLNRREEFRKSQGDIYPHNITLFTYDKNNNNIKTESSSYNTLTGKRNAYFVNSEYKYSNGKLSKVYTTTNSSPKHLEYEVTAWTHEVPKTRETYLFNYGNPNNLNSYKLPLREVIYNSSGKKTGQNIYTYTYDSKGYILTMKISDGSKIISTTTYKYYPCK